MHNVFTFTANSRIFLYFPLVPRILLQCGADIDKQDIDGWTPLHAAAYWGQKDVVKLLAENLADMDAKNYVVSDVF